MTAYVISEVDITNEPAATMYKQLAAASIEAYGGQYLVRAAEAHVVEGQTTSRRIVVVEFPSIQRIREWYTSPEYARALAYRDAGLLRRLIFVDGVNDDSKTVQIDCGNSGPGTGSVPGPSSGAGTGGH